MRRWTTAGREPLARALETLGKSAETSGSLTGSMHRGWVNIRASIMGKNDAAILSECERGEDFAKSSYEQALKKDLPPSIRAVVERRYHGVLQHHDAVRDMERAAKDGKLILPGAAAQSFSRATGGPT